MLEVGNDLVSDFCFILEADMSTSSRSERSRSPRYGDWSDNVSVVSRSSSRYSRVQDTTNTRDTRNDRWERIDAETSNTLLSDMACNRSESSTSTPPPRVDPNSTYFGMSSTASNFMYYPRTPPGPISSRSTMNVDEVTNTPHGNVNIHRRIAYRAPGVIAPIPELRFVETRLYPNSERLPQVSSIIIRAVKFLSLSSDLLMGSGLHLKRPGSLYLYCRAPSVDQLGFMETTLFELGKGAYVFGQPGTGKSAFTYYFGCAKVQSNQVDEFLWLSFPRESARMGAPCRIVRITQTTKEHATMDTLYVACYLESLLQRDNDYRQLIVTDGVINKEIFSTIHCEINVWRADSPYSRFWVACASMGVGSNSDPSVALDIECKMLWQPPWEHDEYLEALTSPEVVASVEEFLDADPHADTVVEKLEAKMFFSGGCARYTFAVNTETLKDLLNHYLIAVQDITALSRNGAPSLRFRLLSMLADGTRFYVCRYVEMLVALKRGPQYLLEIARQSHVQRNPTMLGNYFESYFFSRVAAGDLELRTLEDVIVWPKSNVRLFCPKTPTPESCPIGEWLQPLAWKYPTFAAVYLKESGCVRIVLTTIAHEHKVDFGICFKFITALQHATQYIVRSVNFCFVIPDYNLNEFDIGGVSNIDSLDIYHHGDPLNIMRIYGIEFPVKVAIAA